ncbi:MAG: cytochrome c [Chloroflexota bacterium]|nr:cytochrome c [Chloroflexota bacterium]
MRIKTLGVVLVSAMSLFTAFYWLTDGARREARFETQIEELLAYGEEVFGPSADDTTANCAACHGADGTGGQVGTTGRTAPNLHSKSIYEKLKAGNGGSFTEFRKPGEPPDYVNLVIRFGGVVVSGDVNSPMPAWSNEVGGALTINQIDALTALVETWALEAGALPDVEVPDTIEAGQKVYVDSGCGSCHGPGLAGVADVFPGLLNIGNEPVIDLPTPISRLDELQADYIADARSFLERWIRDSAVNYNDGVATGMPVHPEGRISTSAMQALITFLLSQKQ